MTTSPLELDIAAQADALRAFARSPSPGGLDPAGRDRYDRIVLTGMGSSHFAALPTWRSLVAKGRPAWWVDSGQLLDTPDLVTPDTLLVATSQSGASGEVAALFGPSSPVTRPRRTIGVTNDPSSPLARYSDVVIELRSGSEATVSTKSYLNSLAAHQRLLGALTGDAPDDGTAGATGTVLEAAGIVEQVLDQIQEQVVEHVAEQATEHAEAGEALTRAARDAAATEDRRIVMVGNRDHAATALYAGLITKETAKVAAEGFVGGQFRHGPLELAGPGLTALLFGVFADDRNPSLRRLAEELVRAGSHVVIVGDLALDGAETVVVPRGEALAELCAGALAAQRFAVELARARGLEPGSFTYGSKITTAL